MKYVITDHNKVAMGTGCHHFELSKVVSGNVVRAGHCDIINGRIKVRGESIGYGIKSEQKDAEILERAFGLRIK